VNFVVLFCESKAQRFGLRPCDIWCVIHVTPQVGFAAVGGIPIKQPSCTFFSLVVLVFYWIHRCAFSLQTRGLEEIGKKCDKMAKSLAKLQQPAEQRTRHWGNVMFGWILCKLSTTFLSPCVCQMLILFLFCLLLVFFLKEVGSCDCERHMRAVIVDHYQTWRWKRIPRSM